MGEKGNESKEEWPVRWEENQENVMFWKAKRSQQHKMRIDKLELNFSQMEVISDLNKSSYDEGLGIKA